MTNLLNRYGDNRNKQLTAAFTIVLLLFINLCLAPALTAQNRRVVSQYASPAGIVTTTIDGFALHCKGSTLQADGKLLAIGEIANDRLLANGIIIETGKKEYPFFLLRFLNDGSLDTLFGEKGIAVVDDEWRVQGFDVFVLPNGKILVSGHIYPVETNNKGNTGVAILRFLPNGRLDKTFGQGGKSVISVGNCPDMVTASLLQPDGKLLVSGYEDDYEGNCSDLYKGFLLRVDTEGVPDSSFGENGKVLFMPKSDSEKKHDVYSLALQADGNIVAAVAIGTKIRLMHISKDGKSVSFMDEKSWESYDYTHKSKWHSKALSVQADGQILFMRDFYIDSTKKLGNDILKKWMLTRYRQTGEVDSTFAQSGDLKSPINNQSSFCLVADKNGSIFIGGRGFIQKISAEGTIEEEFFKKNNKNAYEMGACPELHFLPDGSLLASGSDRMTVGHFQPDGEPDKNFGAILRSEADKKAAMESPLPTERMPYSEQMPVKQYPSANKNENPKGIKKGELLTPSNYPFSGRKVEKIPRLNDKEINVTGQLIMAICIDNTGKVISAKRVAEKSTITNKSVILKITQHVLQYKFAPADKAINDCGEIKFNFL